MYHKSGVDLVVGSLWSGQLCGCRCYAMDNGMVLMSSLSTAPNLAIDDSIFRLAPHDLRIAYPISKAMEDLGVEEVVILQRETSSSDDIAEEFSKYYTGTVAATIRYPVEYWGDDFRECLDQAEEALNEVVEQKGTDSVALLYLGFSEVRHALGLSSDYQTLSNVTWFGCSGTANLDTVVGEAGEEASRVKLISPQATFSGSPTYDSVNAEYEAQFGEPLGLYGANLYDECWIMALSVLEANSTSGLQVQEALPGVASGYKGASGLCLLDENGDRLSVDYGFWGYFEANGTYKCLRCGTYSYESDGVEWDEALIPSSGEERG
ncbi:MAG: ABC transporter substrate-binding protein [Candidatus Bathyarchaeota archaeon]|nr:ABC transporter substrate-binding protein [Candidatus Bathyarchaeota archaeon]